jgi:pimeloyl-[acyl-carrier protein] methyl ester esterase
MNKILFPGWGIPKEEYAALESGTVIDYGFFSNENTAPDLMNPDEWLNSIKPPKPYIIIAHSMGTIFALCNSSLRDNAEAVIIAGGFAKFIQSDDNPYGKPSVEPAMMQKQLRRNPALLLKSFYRAAAAPEQLKIQVPQTFNIKQLHVGLELLKKCDIRSNLISIDIPVTILHGKNDSIVSVKLAEYMQQNIRNSSLEIIENTGHALPLTSPQKIDCK